MGRPHKKSVSRDDEAKLSKADEQEVREQEVLRANRELAAYFKGQRTEREARAALKIIKAFVKHRERTDAGIRRPLPGTQLAAAAKSDHKKTAAPVKKVRRRSVRRPVPVPASTPREANAGVEEASLDPGA
jgi:hypothetical protein